VGYRDKKDTQMCNFIIDEDAIMHKLDKLRNDKPAGADGFVPDPNFQKWIKPETARPLTLLSRKINENVNEVVSSN